MLGNEGAESVSFEEFHSTNDAKKVQLLRTQLAVVDRAIELLAQDDNVTATSDFFVTHIDNRKTSSIASHAGSRAPPRMRSSLSHPAEMDKSYKIDLMSTQLGTCPQCLAEMDVKKLKSHVAHSCPNKLITCPELNCGRQLPLKHLRRHLLEECEITRKRRQLVKEAEDRKQMEAQRKVAAAAEARLTMSNMQPPALVDHAGVNQVEEQPVEDLGPAEGDFEDLESRHTICPKCGEAMRQSQLTLHLTKLCPRRRVMCPNFHTGCQQRLIPLYLLQTHLATECAAEKHREKMIERSKHRQELVKCPACGKQVALMDLRKHERELCSNRRVPCRNHALGCNVMVRLRDRAQHERVDTKRALRPALYLPSHGAHLAIREDDLVCPWTAEYWIYRPPAKESLKVHIRNAILLIPKYMVAFAAEVQVQRKVQRLVDLLKNSGAANDALAAADGGKMSKEQRALRAKELAQARVDQVNALSALVPVYSETVLAYTRAFQELAVSVEAGCACADEVLANLVTMREPEAVTLKVKYPGEVAAAPTLDFSFMTQKKRDKQRGAGSEEGKGDAASVSSSGTKHSKGSRSQASNRSGGSGNTGTRDGEDQGGQAGADDGGEEGQDGEGAEEGEEEYGMEEDAEWDIEEEMADGEATEGGQAEEREGAEGAEGEDGGHTDGEGADGEGQGGGQSGGSDSQAGFEKDGASRAGSTAASASAASSITAKKSAASKQKPLRLDWDALQPYLYSGSALSSLFQACLHAERPRAFAEAEQQVNQPSQDQAPLTLLLHPDLDLTYLLPSQAGLADVEHSWHDEESAFASAASGSPSGQPHLAVPRTISADDISFAVRELQATGIATFFADVLVAPKRSSSDCALPWTAWQRVLTLIARALKTDFDSLQDWRVEAGLLKPDSVPSANKGKGKGSAEQNAKHEKAMEKKEKARMKRELKKLEKLQAAQQGAEGQPAESAASAAGSAAVATGKKDDAIFKRVGELLKAGCGTGVLAESTSRSAALGERNYTKICLSLGSGLSLLTPTAVHSSAPHSRPLSRAASPSGDRPGTAATASDGDGTADLSHEDFEVEDDQHKHHYDLLMRPQDLTRLAHSAGKIGLVAIPQTVGDLTGLNDYDLQKMDKAGELQDEGDESEGTDGSRPNSPSKASVASTHSGESKRSKAGKHKRSKTKKGAGSGSSTKKAASLVRVGMEARSFEVEVPRGRWTHLALVATALPQNKLTLYMDGILVKTLKDCAFPLPMAALGGGTQSFETFEGALLDVRYWSVQRSALDIIDQMHKLLELEKDGIPGNNPPGLVAWWTFEDGGGTTAAADVTGHRFKTKIVRRQLVNKEAKEGPIVPQHADSRPTSPHAGTPSAASGAGKEQPQPPGYFCAEEETRYKIPDQAAQMLPAVYFKLLPFHQSEESHDPNSEDPGAQADLDDLESSAVASAGAKQSIASAAAAGGSRPPWESWMQQLPRWSWLNAETLPTPQVPSAVRMALDKVGKVPDLPGSAHADSSVPPLPPNKSAAAQTGQRNVLPVPSLRARGVCPYELRRHRLATKGRELQREVDCPLGCAEKIKTVDVRFHVRFSCLRRMVKCRFDYCPATFPVEQREQHERTDCRYIYARNKILSMAELHKTIFPCSLCSEGVMQRDLEDHERNHCPHRLVRCVYGDCEMGKEAIIPAHLLHHHLRFDCTSEIRKNRFLLVERARERLHYPRPWGLTVELTQSAQGTVANTVDVLEHQPNEVIPVVPQSSSVAVDVPFDSVDAIMDET